MIDFKEKAERLMTSALGRTWRPNVEALATALSDAYEAGKREERGACAVEMEKLGETERNDAVLWAKDGLTSIAKVSEIRSRAHLDAAFIIRSREVKA